MQRGSPDPNEDLSILTVSELKDRLREERLKVSGGKQELIDRLKDYYDSIPEGCEYSVPVHVTVKQPDVTCQPILENTRLGRRSQNAGFLLSTRWTPRRVSM